MTAPVPDHAMIDPRLARSLLLSPPAPSPKTWRFTGTGGFGWWKVFVDSAGALSIVSDFGNYGHHWSRHGIGTRTVLQFLIAADDDYLMGKLARRDWFDLEASVKAARRTLIEQRRDLRIPCTKDEEERVEDIREVWNRLKEVGDEFDWNDLLMNGIGSLDTSDMWGTTAKDFDPQVRAFFKEAWPQVREQMRAEVERGETGGPT